MVDVRQEAALAGEGVSQSEFTPANIVLLVGCTLGIVLNIGSLFNGSMAAFMKPIAADTGWSRGEISLGVTAAMAPLVLLIPLMGRLVDKVGSRRVLAVAGPLYGLAIAGLGLLPVSYPLFLSGCVLVGVAGAGTYVPVYNALMPHFFRRRLGLAVGLASTGAGIGLILFPVITQAVIAASNWRTAYLVLGALTVLILLPTALALLRDPPRVEGRGLIGGGAGPALRSFKFWRLGSAYLLSGMAISAGLVHIVPHMTDLGLSPAKAALYASYLGLASVGARLIAGALLDYVDAGLLGAVGFLLAGAGMLLLCLRPEPGLAIAAVVLIGSALGAESDLVPFVTRRVFGLQAYGVLVGCMAAAFLAGVLLGPLVAGLVFDATGSYQAAFGFFAAGCAVAAAAHATATLKSPR